MSTNPGGGRNKSDAPGCLTVIGGLLALIVIGTLLKVIGEAVQRHNVEQLYHIRPQIHLPLDGRFDSDLWR